jgi:Conserved TM helix
MVLAENHTWGDKLENGFTAIFGFIPELIGALLILIIGYFVARVLGSLVTRLLQRGGVDRTVMEGQGGRFVSRLTSSPADLLGRIVFWVLFLGAISLAVTALGIDALTNFVGEVFAYLPNVLAALVIFLVAGAIAGAIVALVGRTMGDTPTGKVVASVAPILVMAIAAFMILDQLKIAEDIVRITYMALMGGLALALALAFGLGGRDVAARMLEGAYVKGQQSREQVRRDLAQGRAQAREDFERARGAAEERVESDTMPAPPRTDVGTGAVPGGATERVERPTEGTERPTEPVKPPMERVERVPADEVDAVPPGSHDEETRGRP